MWHITEDSQWTTLRDTGTKPMRDKKAQNQNSVIGMNYLASFSLTYGFHFFLFFILKQKLEENFSFSSKSINFIYRTY